jgi:CDGSH-type Zn-finger protein
LDFVLRASNFLDTSLRRLTEICPARYIAGKTPPLRRQARMSEVTIKVRDDGPLLVDGPVKVIDATGNVFTIPTGKPAIALCRCGQSQRKPFCDGSHKGCNFQAADRANGGSAERS